MSVRGEISLYLYKGVFSSISIKRKDSSGAEIVTWEEKRMVDYSDSVKIVSSTNNIGDSSFQTVLNIVI